MNQGFRGWPAIPLGQPLIASFTLPQAAPSILIPLPLQDSRHCDLRLVAQWRGDTAAASVFVNCQFNGDTGSNYDWSSWEWLANGVATAQGALAATSMQFAVMSAASATAGFCGQCELVIANYTGAVFQKTAVSNANYRTGTTSTTIQGNRYAGWWRNTSPITSILLAPSAGNFAAGSTVRVGLAL